jgi:dihydroorotase
MANTNPVISDEADAVAVNERVRCIGLVESFQAVSLTRNFDGRDASALPLLDRALVPVATEDGKEVASAAVMLDAMKGCAASGVIVSCHCEDPELAIAAKPFRMSALAALREGRIDDARAELAEAERLLRLAEDTMTQRNLALADAAGCRVHIAHVSTSGALESVRRAKALAAARSPRASVTCEATPHHLSLTDQKLEIVNPPLRSAADRETLIAGLLDGTIDAIATDHAPHTAEDKASGAPGFSGIEIAFPACLTSLVKTGRLSLQKLSALMAANPASILGLRRGLIAPGYDADFALVDIDGEFTVDPSLVSEGGGCWHSKGKYTPLAGTRLEGKILATFKRGRIVYSVF